MRSGRWGPYRQAGPPPARHRPGARSARREGRRHPIADHHREETIVKPRSHLRVELLEDRSVPSTFAAFDLDSPDRGPFPSDRFTVADASQLTGLRANLPLPDAATRPSDYDDLSVINTLDGFNLQPRLSISFDGPIDVNSVNSDDVFVIRLGDTQNPQDRGGQVIGINQVVWDPATNTLHVESDQLLDQHTRYALIVTC